VRRETQNISAREAARLCDAEAKGLLSHREVIANILSMCVPECQCISPEHISDNLLGEVRTGEAPVDDLSRTALIRGGNAEDSSPKEGGINFESQSARKGYPMGKRAMCYASRMISSQKGTVLRNSDHGKIRKSYSIWIMGACRKRNEGTAAIFEMAKGTGFVKSFSTMNFWKPITGNTA